MLIFIDTPRILFLEIYMNYHKKKYTKVSLKNLPS